MLLINIKKSVVLQMLIAVTLGSLLGALFPEGKMEVCIQIAKVFIHWVKIIAGPYLFLAVFQAMVEVQTEFSVGVKLISIALLNTTLAILIGVSLTLTLIETSTFDLHLNTENTTAIIAPQTHLSFSGWLQTFTPDSLFAPFIKNEILLIALLALILGIATRSAFKHQTQTLTATLFVVDQLKAVLEKLLHWILKIMPLAVFLIIAGSVSKYGFSLFSDLSRYVLAVILALALQCILVYGGWTLAIARIPFSRLWREVKTPFLYSIGVNSSLATLPLTLQALKKLNISDRSATLGAGVATNLNNDGIVLYEASAVFFVAAISNIDWSLWQMMLAALTCIVASMGITGVPEAGFISLTVVVSALGLPLEALPLLLSVDWILGRLRSGVNVLSDVTLSIALDTVAPPKPNEIIQQSTIESKT